MSKSGSKLKVETLKAWLEELKRKRKVTSSVAPPKINYQYNKN